MNNIQIRKATLHDAEYISLLARITFTEAFGHLFPDKQDLRDYFDRTFSVAKFRASLQKENNVSIPSKLENRLSSFIAWENLIKIRHFSYL